MRTIKVSILDRLRIHELRGQAVVLDSDLAAVYGVSTKAFNQAVNRNRRRFPADFLLQPSRRDWNALQRRAHANQSTNLRSQIVTSSLHGGRRYIPWAFTEHGAIMAATILNSPRAVAMSVYVVRAFLMIRNELLAQTTLEKRLAHIEKSLVVHDTALRDIFDKLRPLLLPPPVPPRGTIGFHAIRSTG